MLFRSIWQVPALLLWDGSSVVHEEFKTKQLEDMKALYPDAAVVML